MGLDRVQIAAVVVAVGILLYLAMRGPGLQPRPSARPPVAPAAEPAPLPSHAASSGRVNMLPEVDEPALIDLTQQQTMVLENDAIRLVVSNVGGRLQSVQLKHYEDRIGSGAGPVELVTVGRERGTLVSFLGGGPFRGVEGVPYQVREADARHVVLETERPGIKVTRALDLDQSGYGAHLRLRVDNTGAAGVAPVFKIAWYGRERRPRAPDRFQNYGLLVSRDGSVKRRLLHSRSPLACASGGGGIKQKKLYPPVDWAGIESQYFMTVVIPENPADATAAEAPLDVASGGRTELSYPAIEVPPGRHLERTYRLYLGPKVLRDVRRVDPGLEAAVRRGWAWVRPLVDLFVVALSWTHANVVSNYGVAIILITILVRLATAPLTHRSMKSMRGLSAIGPEMKEIQEKYKDDRARLQQEMMSLYRRKGINPVTSMGGGCLPMLIQMPFLLGLYFALQSSIELRHAPFMLWIQDLSAPEDLFSVAGIPVRVLPLLMGVSMVLQQKLTPTSATADPSQRQMMTWMSLFFIFLFYSFPSGLVLYWFVSNLLAILQQLLVNRRLDAAPAGK